MKTLWPKEKVLIMSNLTFGHNVFKSHLLLLRQNASAGGKRLTVQKMLRAIDKGQISCSWTFPTCRHYSDQQKIVKLSNKNYVLLYLGRLFIFHLEFTLFINSNSVIWCQQSTFSWPMVEQPVHVKGYMIHASILPNGHSIMAQSQTLYAIP